MKLTSKIIPEFLAGGGKMGELVRNFDWSQTAIGEPGGWSQSLQSAISIMLANRFPMVLWWGEELIQFYNDAYISILGLKHPKALGQTARECWAEIWDIMGPLIKTPLNGGQATWMDDILLEINRKNFIEETHFTIAHSPVPDNMALNGIGGVLGTMNEITAQVIGERRMILLREVAARQSESRTAGEACLVAAEIVNNYAKEIPFALFYLLNADKNHTHRVAVAGTGGNEDISPEKIDLNNAAEDKMKWNFGAALKSKKLQVVNDLNDRFEKLPQGPWLHSPHSAVVIPLRSNKANDFIGFLVCGISSRLRYDDRYQSFFELLSAQISTAIATACVIEDERKRAEALAENDKAKTVFFNNISHEFRTPLTLMLGPLEELMQQPPAEISSRNLLNVETTHRNALRLLMLVNNLLDFSLIESGRHQANFVLVDINSFTVNLASNFRSIIESAGLQLNIQTEVISDPVYVDKSMWEKIVFNLLSNAFKYTLNGSISIQLFAENNKLVLNVIDSGTGIPENELPHIFERFHRVKATTGRTPAGTGIGLSLVKELIRLHGGTITVESTEGKGSTFTVTIPTGMHHLPPDQVIAEETDIEQMSPVSYVEEATTWLNKPVKKNQDENVKNNPTVSTILIVDDDADMCAYMESLLEKKYNIITASNGREALDKINEHLPALVLCDIMMPVMDGFQLLQEIKQDRKISSIPIILVSARAGEEATIEGYDLGADDYLVKPFSAKELKARVRSQINLAQMRKESETYVRNFFMQSPVAICILKGGDYTVELANDYYLQIVEKGEDFIGKPIFESLPELKTQGIKELLDQVMQSGNPYYGTEMEIDLSRNEKRHQGFYNFVYQPLRDKDNVVTGIIGVVTEVTEQVLSRIKNEENEHRYHEMIYSSPSAIGILKGPHLIFTTANDALIDIMGKGKDIIGKPFFEVMPELVEQGYTEIYQNVYNLGKPFIANEMPVNISRFGKMEVRYYNFVLQAQRNSSDEINGVGIIAVEVTSQARLNLQIKESEERFRTLADNMPLFAFIIEPNAEASVSYWNQTWLDYTGQKFEEALGREWDGIIHPDDIQGAMDVYIPAFEKRQPYLLPGIRVKRYDGEYRWHMIKSNPRFLPNGEFMGFIGVGYDVHERKLAEEMLEYRTTLLEAHNEASIDGILLVDAKGNILSYNRRFTEIWNMPQEILDAKDDEAALAFAMTQLEDPQQFIEKVKWMYANPTEPTLDELDYKDGKIVERHGYPVIGKDGTYYAWSWTFRDITELKMSEKTIKESEAHFRLLADLMPEKVTHSDPLGNIIYYNQSWLDYTGLTIDKIKDVGWTAMLHPDDLEKTNKSWHQSIDTGNDLEMEFRIQNKEGEYKWHLGRSKAVKTESGKIKLWISVTTDIHIQNNQREKLEKAVRKRTHELQQANEELQQKNQVIALSKYNRRFLSEFSEKFSAYKIHNEFFESLVQFIAATTSLDYVFVGKLEENNKEEFSVQTIAIAAFGKLIDNIHYPLPDGPCEKVIRGKLYPYLKECKETFPNNKTMEQFNVKGYIGYPLKDEQGNVVGLISVMHEKEIDEPETVSAVLKVVARRAELELERIHHEQQLLQNNKVLEEKNEQLQKMNKELHAFTYISSHDLQEPLRKINTFGKLITEREEKNLTADGKGYFKRMQNAAKHMQTLIEDLLEYSQTNSTERKREKADLNKIVEEVLLQLSDTIREKNPTIEVGNLCEVKIIPFQFGQLFNNLISNSLKFSAPEIKTHITIKSEMGTGEEFSNKMTDLTEGMLLPQINYCHISFTDNGIGFNPEYKDRIFEVFQRLHRKEEYPGTGIGLAIVKKIVENHQGIIIANSELSKGATFDIYIPA